MEPSAISFEDGYFQSLLQGLPVEVCMIGIPEEIPLYFFYKRFVKRYGSRQLEAFHSEPQDIEALISLILIYF